MRLQFVSLFVVGLLASWSSIACAEEPFRIGMVTCLTGACAEIGQNSQRGAELAAKELNDNGGVLGRKIEFKIQDSHEAESGAEAVSAFRNLRTDQSIHYYIGPTWTPAGLAIAPIAAKMQDVIMTSPSLGVANFNEAGENLFNLWPHDEIGTRALARYALKQGWQRTAIFSSQQPWCLDQGHAFQEEYKKFGGVVADYEEPLPQATDLNTELMRIVRSKPDAVFFSNFLQYGMAALKLRKLNFKGTFICILLDNTQLEISQGALDGALYASYPGATGAFVEKYTVTYGAKPGIGSDSAYDVVKLYAKCITEAKSFDTQVVQKLMLAEQYDGASGHIVFDSKGGVKKTPTLYKVNGAKFEAVAALE